MMKSASWKGKAATAATFIALALASGSAQAQAPAHDKKSKSWNEKMRSLGKTLQALLIDLNSEARFNDPKNFKRIEKNAQEFARLAHDLKPQSKDAPSPDADLSVQIIANQFSSEAEHAVSVLKWGHRGYARNVLKSMTGYCIACHTRSQAVGIPQLTDKNFVDSLKPLERADFLASTRQFEKALEEYEKILADPQTAANRPFDWERAVRSGLAVAVRVLKSPDRALSIVDRVLATPKAASFLKEQASQWKQSLNSWKAEPVSRPQTEEGYYSLAMKLIADAKSLQKYPADRSADVLYLRASAAVHDLLNFAPNGSRATDALYLAGLAYEVLNDLNLWDAHEFYYIACIQKSPHTEKARQCFRHYEQSIYGGFTGSSGTDIPKDVRDRLRLLDQLSNPQAPTPAARS
jgi:hypothetical protein